MSSVSRAIAACVILAASAAGQAVAAPGVTSASVTSFGSPRLHSLADLAAVPAFSITHETNTLTLGGGFAASTALTSTLALDSAQGGGLAARFTNFDRSLSPMLNSGASFLALGDTGRYGGITYAPSADVKMRLGVSAWNARLDNVSFNAPAATGLPFAYDQSSASTVMAGLSWDAGEWISLGVNAVSSYSRNTPLAYGAVSPLGQASSTQALELSARFSLGNEWVTTTHFAQGFTQLNQRTGFSGNFDAQAYSITVARQGVFGDDALGFTLSRPAPGMMGSFAAFTTASDLPPMMLAAGKSVAPETDLQIGYVTSFMGGRLALQANAGYQFNAQGQTGATAVSVLSRAKIKF